MCFQKSYFEEIYLINFDFFQVKICVLNAMKKFKQCKVCQIFSGQCLSCYILSPPYPVESLSSLSVERSWKINYCTSLIFFSLHDKESCFHSLMNFFCRISLLYLGSHGHLWLIVMAIETSNCPFYGVMLPSYLPFLLMEQWKTCEENTCHKILNYLQFNWVKNLFELINKFVVL